MKASTALKIANQYLDRINYFSYFKHLIIINIYIIIAVSCGDYGIRYYFKSYELPAVERKILNHFIKLGYIADLQFGIGDELIINWKEKED